jgi:squalene-hopene/tetraprenyl-beta-curcumene cyclase
VPGQVERGRLAAGLDLAVDRLMDAMEAEGYWEGELASSALATATALVALAAVDRSRHDDHLRLGVDWLRRRQNPDGGWGDTPDSPSNLSTTLLCVAALSMAAEEKPSELDAGRRYVREHGGATPEAWADALAEAYGIDRTFSAPILAHCAIAGQVPWSFVPPLPFELSVLPGWSFRSLPLHVVSYALPALIAVGLAVHRCGQSGGRLRRRLRGLIERTALRRLSSIQPASGGFLEAVPLTSFVAMSLAVAGEGDHPVVGQCVSFLTEAVRPDGSWPIDSNLSVWLTSNAICSLASADRLDRLTRRTAGWLVNNQLSGFHPYTQSPPGGWAWTHLPGGVPDADDTARAVRALAVCLPRLTDRGSPWWRSILRGCRWLDSLQNDDGGWPTFCRGWGRLPFDRSAPDLTAHALEAFGRPHWRPVQRGLGYLRRSQREDGAWIPLWFGNQHAPDHENPVLGTANVLPALIELDEAEPAVRGVAFLLDAQDVAGGWGGDRGVPPTVEETALAVAALAQAPPTVPTVTAARRGTAWLLARIDEDSWQTPAPIGLYFAKLWYSERLYPIIWMVEALGQAIAHPGIADP